MKVGLQVMGANELEAELRKLSTRISRRLAREALTFGAEPMRAEAARKAPRRSPAPDLADHIIIAPARTIGRELAAVKVGPEKGTSSHGAQPFLRPAFDNQHTRAIQRVSDELWRALAARGVSRSVFEDGPIESLGGGGLL
jgi:HK97 gp10 family phage protein